MKPFFLALRAKIYDYQELKDDFFKILKGRWVRDENLHLTLCYFGDSYSIDELLTTLPKTINLTESLELTSLDYFKHNNVLYAKTQSTELEALRSSICNMFALKDTKTFTPHVTLMRVKEVYNQDGFEQKILNYNDKKIGIVDTALHLMQSHPHKDGVKYESVKKFQ